MPPRKSETMKVATADEATPQKEMTLPVRDGLNIEDFNLPKSIVTRLAKGVLPPNTQIQGNALLAMTKSATVFVNYLATHAHEHTANANRKTIQPQDVLDALEELEFPEFTPRLKAELAKFMEIQDEKKSKSKAKKATGAAAGSEEIDGEDVPDDEGEADGEPAAKRAKVEGGSVATAKAPAGEEEGEAEEEDGPDAEEEEEESDGEEKFEVEEREEELEVEEKEEGDEALDNGEDSD